MMPREKLAHHPLNRVIVSLFDIPDHDSIGGAIDLNKVDLCQIRAAKLPVQLFAEIADAVNFGSPRPLIRRQPE